MLTLLGSTDHMKLVKLF